MTRSADSYVVRKLADCIELLPKLINNPRKMPFVQDIIRRALEDSKSHREAASRGFEIFSQSDEHRLQLNTGGKYRFEFRDAEYYRKKAEEYRKPVTSVWLSDTDKEALKAGFEDDAIGIFEFFERQAAEIAEWLREHRHPRDAENFRRYFSFACGDALLYSPGVEVSPGVFMLDLSFWEAEVAKPLCDDLRQIADEIATGGTSPDPTGPVPDDGFRYKGEVYRGLTGYPWLFLNAVWLAKDQAMQFDDLAKPVYSDAEKFVTHSAINGWQRAVNSFFGKHALPFHMSASEKTRTAKLVMRPEEIREKI